MPQLPGRDKGRGGERCGQVDRRHGFLHRPGRYRHIVIGMKLPLIGESRLRPGALDDLQPLLEAFRLSPIS